MSEHLNIGFIGTGNMASAIIRGLTTIKKNQAKDDITMYLYNRTAAKAASLAAETGAVFCSELTECIDNSDLLILAVKPQNMPELLDQIAPLILAAPKRKIVLSVAAGIEIKVYEKALPGVAVARAMPNTSAAVLASMTGLMAGELLTDADRAVISRIFDAVGKTVWIPESSIHAFIAIAGSANAYYYYFTELLTEAGIKLGIDATSAAAITRQVAIGAGKMLEQKPDSAADLRIAVTSPGGTTAQALAAFSKTLPQAILEACTACAERSAEMAKSSD